MNSPSHRSLGWQIWSNLWVLSWAVRPPYRALSSAGSGILTPENRYTEGLIPSISEWGFTSKKALIDSGTEMRPYSDGLGPSTLIRLRSAACVPQQGRFATCPSWVHFKILISDKKQGKNDSFPVAALGKGTQRSTDPSCPSFIHGPGMSLDLDKGTEVGIARQGWSSCDLPPSLTGGFLFSTLLQRLPKSL